MSELIANPEGEVEVESISTAGIIRDAFGNTWLVPPEDGIGEEKAFNYDPCYLPNKDPDFHYQFEPIAKTELTEAEGFRSVKKSEIGLLTKDDRIRTGDYGAFTKEDKIHDVGDLRLFKIPMVLKLRKDRIAKAEADRVKAATEPTHEPSRLANLRRGDQPIVEERKERTTFSRPKDEKNEVEKE